MIHFLHLYFSHWRDNMSFLNIKDKRKRDKTIEDYLALKKRLKHRNLEERQDFQDYQHDLEEQYEPVIASNERMAHDITEQLVPIKEQIQQLAAHLTERPKLKAAEETEAQSAKREVNQFGPLGQDFISAYTDEERRKADIDTTFGIRYENGKWKIGDKHVVLNPDDSMKVGDEIYEGTPGFWSLVAEKNPTEFTESDFERYKELLHETSALHHDYDMFEAYPRANKSKKWRNILGPIWNEFKYTAVVKDANEEDADESSFLTGDDTNVDGGQTTGGNGVKMYLQKKDRCYELNKTMDGGIKLRPRPKLAGVRGDGLYLRHGSDIYHGEGLLLGERSPFRNIPVLGWIL